MYIYVIANYIFGRLHSVDFNKVRMAYGDFLDV